MAEPIKDPLAFRLFVEIGIIEQLARNQLEREMPDGLKVSQFGVLNHLDRLGGEWSPARLANAFQVTKQIWKKLQATIIDFHEPGKFITYLGYEWSGNPGAGGDHNVYYLNDNESIHRCSHALIDDLSDLDTDRYPISELYNEFKNRDDVMIIPHIGGRKGSLDVLDENLTPFIEIVSVHGHFEWFAQDAIDRDLKVGFIASSDTHSGRPGNSVPASYIEAVKSGFTAVYAEELTRDSLWNAFKKRHVYATTGTRIILEFNCFEFMMGDEIIINKNPVFDVNVVGTAGIEYIELYRGSDLLYKHNSYHGEYSKNKICIRWTGARVKNRRRNKGCLRGRFSGTSVFPTWLTFRDRRRR